MTDCNEELNSGIGSTPPTPESSSSPPPTQESTTETLFMNMEPLNAIASGSKVVVPKSPHFSRKEVVNAFHQAFDLIGGIPRLALWANANETDFYRLYARLLPSQNSSALGEQAVLRIEIAIPPSPLDEPPQPRQVKGEVLDV